MAQLKFRYYLPALIWAVIILTVSSIPHLPPITDEIRFGDKIAHFGEYFIFAILVANTLWRMNKSAKYIIVATAIFCTAFGILDELHQLFIPSRDCDPLDMTSDALGAIVASLIYVWWRNRRPSRAFPQDEVKN